MIVTLILRLDAAAIGEGELRGWAEFVEASESGVAPDRIRLDGMESLVDAAVAALRARRPVSNPADNRPVGEEPAR